MFLIFTSFLLSLSLFLQSSDFTEAIVWYNYSLSLLTENADMEKPNIAKLQRNRASSYINLQQFQKVSG